MNEGDLQTETNREREFTHKETEKERTETRNKRQISHRMGKGTKRTIKESTHGNGVKEKNKCSHQTQNRICIESKK